MFSSLKKLLSPRVEARGEGVVQDITLEEHRRLDRVAVRCVRLERRVVTDCSACNAYCLKRS